MSGVELLVIGETALTLGDAFLAAGALTSAASAISTANTQADYAEYNEQVARNNAVAAQRASRAEAETERRDARRRQARIAAAYSGSGVDLDGSVIDVVEDQSYEDELNALNILYQGEMGRNYQLTQAELDRREAEDLRAAGPIKAGGTILTAASRFGRTRSRTKDPLEDVRNITGQVP